MRQQQSIILYVFIVLIILMGLGLFIFKDNIVDQFLAYNINGPVVKVTNNNAELNLDVLRDSRIKALKNYVSIFDYNHMDKSQDAILANQGAAVIPSTDNTASSTASSTATTTINTIRVRLGNSNPFIKAAK